MIVVIDYGMSNLGSIGNMLKKIGAEAAVSSDPTVIDKATKLILPGVGAFDTGMKNLMERGLLSVLNEKVVQKRTPILGLCLGMQLFTQESEEGKIPGLRWLDAKTVRFKLDVGNNNLKIPHMGWNTLKIRRLHPLFTGMDVEPRFYFIHSYHVVCAEESMVLAETHYGYPFSSIVTRENILGVQFHPEKSHKYGMKLLSNFAEYF